MTQKQKENHEVPGIYRRRKSRDERSRQRDESGRRANEGREEGERTCSRRSPRCRNRIGHGDADPRDRDGHRAGPLAENLVRDARLCQRWQGRVLLPDGEKFRRATRRSASRTGRSRRRRHVGDILRADGVDRRRREKDHGAGEESGELKKIWGGGPGGSRRLDRPGKPAEGSQSRRGAGIAKCGPGLQRDDGARRMASR